MQENALTAAVRSLDQRSRRKPAPTREAAFDELQALLAECTRLTNCLDGSFWVVDPGRGGLRCFLGLQHEERRLTDFRLRLGEGIAGFCAQVGQPLIVNDVGADARHSPRADRILAHRTHQLLACPLIRKATVLGTMNLLNRHPEATPKFDDADLFVATLFAAAAADHIMEHDLWNPAEKSPPASSGRRGRAPKTAPPASPSAVEPAPVFMSPPMEEIAATIRASRERTLLFTGETGVGKDLLAQWAHQVSRVARGPFVALNCAAIQEDLWESEIFGHARGAFTGAVREKPGQVDLAAGGTLFLNEIGEMPTTTQVKLLSFLDTGEFQRLGEARSRRVRARIIAATNRDLEKDVEAGRFRRDLFYRLAQVLVRVPPLRERPADILALATYRLHRLAQENGNEPPWPDDATREMLVSLPWKGNVRELFAVVETAFYRCRELNQSTLSPAHFPEEAARAAPSLGASAAENEQIERFGQTLFRLGQFLDDLSDRKSQTVEVQTVEPGVAVLRNAELLRAHLDRNRCRSSGRWNVSAVHRRLHEEGRLRVSLRTFARRVRDLFPEV